MPFELARLKRLEELHLDHNPDLDISQAFAVTSKMPKLTILNLEGNGITNLPSNVKNLSLAGLVLDNNPGLRLEETFGTVAGMKSLKVLLLRNNSLNQLPDNLEGLKGLAILDLSGNKFTDDEKSNIKSVLGQTNVIY